DFNLNGIGQGFTSLHSSARGNITGFCQSNGRRFNRMVGAAVTRRAAIDSGTVRVISRISTTYSGDTVGNVTGSGVSIDRCGVLDGVNARHSASRQSELVAGYNETTLLGDLPEGQPGTQAVGHHDITQQCRISDLNL